MMSKGKYAVIKYGKIELVGEDFDSLLQGLQKIMGLYGYPESSMLNPLTEEAEDSTDEVEDEEIPVLKEEELEEISEKEEVSPWQKVARRAQGQQEDGRTD